MKNRGGQRAPRRHPLHTATRQRALTPSAPTPS